MDDVGRCNTVLIAARPDAGEDGVAVVVDGCNLVPAEVAMPGNAFPLTGVNGLHLSGTT